MTQKLPTSQVPKFKNYVEPKINVKLEPLSHYKVNDKIFLVKSRATKEAKESKLTISESNDPIEFYAVNDANFITVEEAEKKIKLLIRDHRNSVRRAARIFDIDRASLAEKNIYLKWILENYSLEEFFGLFQRNVIYDDFVVSCGSFLIRDNPKLDASLIQRDKRWSWLQNRNIDGYWGIPEEYQEVGPLRTAWCEGENVLNEKINLIERLVSLRILEILYLSAKNNATFDVSGKVLSLIPLKEAYDKIDLDLVKDEVKDLNKALDGTELGADLFIEFKSGEVLYHTDGFKKNSNPFKKF